MTTSISSEAVWNYKKYVWSTENWNGGREIALTCFYIVEWPTDRRTKYQQNWCSYIRLMCIGKIRLLSQLGTRFVLYYIIS